MMIFLFWSELWVVVDIFMRGDVMVKLLYAKAQYH
jgi:hypothetical protein